MVWLRLVTACSKQIKLPMERSSCKKTTLFVCIAGDTHSNTQHTASAVLIFKCKKRQQKRTRIIFLFKHRDAVTRNIFFSNVVFGCNAATQPDNEDNNPQIVWQRRIDSGWDCQKMGSEKKKKHDRGSQNLTKMIGLDVCCLSLSGVLFFFFLITLQTLGTWLSLAAAGPPGSR